MKLGQRVGDNAELAIIELVDNPKEREALASAKKRKSTTGKKKKPAGKGKAQPEDMTEVETNNPPDEES
jgi:hypothetical protein